MQYLTFLFRRESVVLTHGTEHYQPATPALDKDVDMLLRRRQIEGLILLELGRHRRENPAPIRSNHFFPPQSNEK